MIKNRAILIYFCLFFLSCTKSDTYLSDNAILVTVNEIPSDVKIPVLAWDMIEEKNSKPSSEGGHGEAPSHGSAEGGHGSSEVKPAEHGGDEPKASEHGGGEAHGSASGSEELIKSDDSSHIVFTSVKLHLREKNSGILKSPSYTIELPRGGGEIDLANYVSNNSGSFYLGFELPELESLKDVKVLFVSKTKKRKIDGEVFGAGCNRFFDISKKFHSNMTKEGIKLNTTRFRHVSVVGGYFIFSEKVGSQVYVTQVSFIDSKNKHLYCDEE